MNIKAMSITKSFNGSLNKFNACEEISMDINQGDFISIVGHTGSGKSTFLSMIGGIMKPTDGTIYYDAIKNTDLSRNKMAELRRKYFSFIFQYPVIIPGMNVIDNILMPLIFKDGVNEEKIKQTENNLRIFDLYKRRKMNANKLSGGEMKKVSIMRALAYGGSILIADEPTSDLDPDSAKAFSEILHTLNDKGVTILLVTHAHNVAAISHTVYEMKDGKIIRSLK